LRRAERTGEELTDGVPGPLADDVLIDLTLPAASLKCVKGARRTAVTESFVTTRLKCSVANP